MLQGLPNFRGKLDGSDSFYSVTHGGTGTKGGEGAIAPTAPPNYATVSGLPFLQVLHETQKWHEGKSADTGSHSDVSRPVTQAGGALADSFDGGLNPTDG